MKRLWILDDMIWKIVSVVIAFVLWLIFSGAQELTTVVSAPIQYRNISSGLDISSTMVEEAHLHLRGSSTQLARLRPESLPLIIDLSSVKTPGERTFSLEANNVRLPAGVQMERAVPSQVRLRFEMRASREVPVEIHTTSPPAGWRVAKSESVPGTLNILGPESRVSRIKLVETDAVDLSTATGPVVETTTSAFTGDPQVSIAGRASVSVKILLERQD